MTPEDFKNNLKIIGGVLEHCYSLDENYEFEDIHNIFKYCNLPHDKKKITCVWNISIDNAQSYIQNNDTLQLTGEYKIKKVQKFTFELSEEKANYYGDHVLMHYYCKKYEHFITSIVNTTPEFLVYNSTHFKETMIKEFLKYKKITNIEEFNKHLPLKCPVREKLTIINEPFQVKLYKQPYFDDTNFIVNEFKKISELATHNSLTLYIEQLKNTPLKYIRHIEHLNLSCKNEKTKAKIDFSVFKNLKTLSIHSCLLNNTIGQVLTLEKLTIYSSTNDKQMMYRHGLGELDVYKIYKLVNLKELKIYCKISSRMIDAIGRITDLSLFIAPFNKNYYGQHARNSNLKCAFIDRDHTDHLICDSLETVYWIGKFDPYAPFGNPLPNLKKLFLINNNRFVFEYTHQSIPVLEGVDIQLLREMPLEPLFF